MYDLKVYPSDKSVPLVKKVPPEGSAGDSTQQNTSPPPKKRDKVTISDKDRKKDAKHELNKDFKESTEGDDQAPEQEDETTEQEVEKVDAATYGRDGRHSPQEKGQKLDVDG